jgi:nitrogen fixation NifU-like protein
MFDMYRENILDHARDPRNYGLLDPCDVDHEEDNPLCGDHLHLTLRLDNDERITAIGWMGEGCAISQASASMLSERLVGMSLAEARALTRDEILDMMGISLTPNRMKCALLSLKTLIVGTHGVEHWHQIEDEEDE